MMFDMLRDPCIYSMILQSSENNTIEMDQKKDCTAEENKMDRKIPVGGRDPIDLRSFMVRNQDEIKKT